MKKLDRKTILLKGFLIFALAYFLAFPILLRKAKELESKKEFNEGFNVALDSVQKIMNKQIGDTTKITKVVFHTDRDTVTYYLSYK